MNLLFGALLAGLIALVFLWGRREPYQVARRSPLPYGLVTPASPRVRDAAGQLYRALREAGPPFAAAADRLAWDPPTMTNYAAAHARAARACGGPCPPGVAAALRSLGSALGQ